MIRSLLVCITLSFSCLDIFGASVLIYKDDGVDETSFERAYSFFESRGNIVGTIDSGSLIGSKGWMSKCDKFVIPGGADCPYDRKLKGIGCSNIREFVRNGGTYIGICAGGCIAPGEHSLQLWQEIYPYSSMSYPFSVIFSESAIAVLRSNFFSF